MCDQDEQQEPEIRRGGMDLAAQASVSLAGRTGLGSSALQRCTAGLCAASPPNPRASQRPDSKHASLGLGWTRDLLVQQQERDGTWDRTLSHALSQSDPSVESKTPIGNSDGDVAI